MSAGNYRTSSTPDLVCVSFSPHLGIAQILPCGRFARSLVVGLRFHRLFEAWWVVGLRVVCGPGSWWAISTSPLRGLVGCVACGDLLVCYRRLGWMDAGIY